jgi:Abortive infection C-terminus
MELDRPRGISDQSWQAIDLHRDRLDRACRFPIDGGAVVGAAKDLCECVARVVLEERAVPYSGHDDMPKLVTAAHRTLDRLPGRGQAAQGAVRNLSQAARSIVTILAELRNELGSGHGRAHVPRVSTEAAVAASDAAALWVRWTLARLDDVQGGDVDLLVQELQGTHYRRGLLERRFDEVGLDSLPADDQRRLGVAVAHRAMSGTFVVRESGVDPLQDRPGGWPEDYRLGVAGGLLLSVDGNVALQSQFVPVLASIVAQMRPEDWAELIDVAAAAPVPLYIAVDQARLDEIRTALEGQVQSLPEGHRAGWLRLAGRFAEAQPRPSFP